MYYYLRAILDYDQHSLDDVGFILCVDVSCRNTHSCFTWEKAP